MRERDITITIRTTQATKGDLDKLAGKIGENLGTKVTKTQAIEVAIREALAARVGS